MYIAKADAKDLQTTLDFLNAAESALERAKFSLQCAENEWESMDDDDPDKIQILKIRKRLAEEEFDNEDDVDNRILMYEFLQEKFYKCSCNWRRVYWAADVLIDNVCDPAVDHLAFLPGLELSHVANEM